VDELRTRKKSVAHVLLTGKQLNSAKKNRLKVNEVGCGRRKFTETCSRVSIKRNRISIGREVAQTREAAKVSILLRTNPAAIPKVRKLQRRTASQSSDGKSRLGREEHSKVMCGSSSQTFVWGQIAVGPTREKTKDRPVLKYVKSQLPRRSMTRGGSTSQ